MTKKAFPVLLASLLSSLSGCSVFMAAQGSEAVDLSVLTPGTPRAAVQGALGRPVHVNRGRSGDIATYQYFSGDEANYRRATTYAVLDGITLGLAELVTFPAEAVQGNRHVVHVVYDRSNRVIGSREAMYDAPLDAPEKLVGLEETLRPNSAVEADHRARLSPTSASSGAVPKLFDAE